MSLDRLLAPVFVLLTLLATTDLLTGADPDLTAAGRQLAHDAGLKPEQFSFHVIDPAKGIHSYRGDQLMIPASNMKVVTAAAVLEELGANHELHTSLYRSGEIRDGVLEGNLIVVGSGDPGTAPRFNEGDTLRELRAWVRRLEADGVRKVRGRLLGDDRAFAGPKRLPEWPEEQLHKWYCAPSGALNLNDNCVDVVLRPVREDAGTSIVVDLVPAQPLFEVDAKIKAVTNKKKHVYSVDRPNHSWLIQVKGRFLESVKERREWITVPDPTLFYLAAFERLLATEGIEVEGGFGRGKKPEQAELVDRFSRPVGDVVTVLLERSQNLYGDCLARILSRNQGGDGSFTHGSQVLEKYLVETVGVREGRTIRDGSGLSRKTRLSAGDLASLIARARSAGWWEAFEAGLPVAGETGTLKKRMRSSTLTGRVRAKTGHLRGVTTLSGVLDTDQGGVVFSLLYNGERGGVRKAERWQASFLRAIQRAFVANSGVGG